MKNHLAASLFDEFRLIFGLLDRGSRFGCGAVTADFSTASMIALVAIVAD